jgi:hypothetical protein
MPSKAVSVRPVHLVLGSFALLGALGTAPAQALTTFTTTNTAGGAGPTPFVATAPGDPSFTMSLQNPVLGNPQGTPNLVSNVNGLCIFSNSLTSNQCDATAPSQMNGLSFQFSKSVYLRSFVIGFAQTPAGDGSAGGQRTMSAAFSQGASNLGTFAFTGPQGNFVNTPQTFSSQAQGFLIPANTLVTLATSGSGLSPSANSSLFLTSLTVDEPTSAAVPAPLPLLGAGAAFGWSRRLRRRLRQTG